MKIITAITNELMKSRWIRRPVQILKAMRCLPEDRDMIEQLRRKNIEERIKIHKQYEDVIKRLDAIEKTYIPLLLKLNHNDKLVMEKYIPVINEIEKYSNNLKVSLPVVLREHQRSMPGYNYSRNQCHDE